MDPERRRLAVRIALRLLVIAVLALWLWAAGRYVTLVVPASSVLLYVAAVFSGRHSRDVQDALIAVGDIPGLLAIVWLAPQELALDGILPLWLVAITLANQRRVPPRLLLLVALFAWAAVTVQTWLGQHSGGYLLAQSFLIAVATMTGYVMLLERRRSSVDPLTGVLARGPGLKELQARIRSGRACRVAFVDLRGFKNVNDTYGHHVGDEVLRITGARLLGAVRAQDLVIRYGGDEFLVSSCGDDLKERIAEAMERPAHVAAHVIPVEARIGVLDVEAGTEVDIVVQEADRRMYRDPGRGRGARRNG